MSAPVLDIRDLDFSRPAAEGGFALAIPALRVAPGGCLALAGESGCGKSTALDLLGLVRRPHRVGRFVLTRRDGRAEDVGAAIGAGLDALAGLRRECIGYVLQQGGLLPFLSVADNMTLTARTDRPPPLALTDLAARLGLSAVLDRAPDRISIGQRQRVAIGRAIMGDPDLILADEPTAALDPPTARGVLALLLDLARERGTALVMASHSWGLIAEFALPVLRAEVVAEGGVSRATFLPERVAA